MASISPRKHANAPQPPNEAEAEAPPAKAKRIARPAHWKEDFRPAPKPRAAQALVPVAATAAAAPLPGITEWREDSGFLIRLLATLAIVNIMLFVLFPLSSRDFSMASETYTPMPSSMVLPSPKGHSKSDITFYAPAPKHAPAPRNAALAPGAADAADTLEVPTWMGQ